MKYPQMEPMLQAEMDAFFGSRSFPVDACFAVDHGDHVHMFRQMEHNVLHLMRSDTDFALAMMHEGFLNIEKDKLHAIPLPMFVNAVRETIYKFEMDKYWSPKTESK